MSDKKCWPRSLYTRIPVLLLALCLPSISQAAFNAYMTLTCNGSDIPGESSVQSAGGVDVSNDIEVFAFGLNVSADFDSATGQISGRRSYKPVRILKRVDKATPLILQALAENQNCEAAIRFFRLNPISGQTEHYYTITLQQARIVSMMPSLPSTIDPASANLPMTEAVSIAFGIINTAHQIDGTEFEDNWQVAR